MNGIFRFCKIADFRFLLKLQQDAFQTIHEFQNQSSRGVLINKFSGNLRKLKEVVIANFDFTEVANLRKLELSILISFDL